jgi:hypothetical protein
MKQQHGEIQPPPGVAMQQQHGEIPPQLIQHAGFLQQLLNLGLVQQLQQFVNSRQPPQPLVVVTDPRDTDQDVDAPENENLTDFESIGFLSFYLIFFSCYTVVFNFSFSKSFHIGRGVHRILPGGMHIFG